MRRFILLFALFVFAIGINAQLLNVPQKRTCGTVEHNAALEAADPSITLRKQQMEDWTQKWIAANPDYQNNKAVITIPIVFHIVYKTAAENISDTRIQEQVDLLNRDFAGLSPHSMGAFSTTLKANTQIQFCLAQRKPDGSATNGIDRKLTTATSFTDTNDPVKKVANGGVAAWDVTKYFNVWVCNLGGGLLGYAQFPTSGINATYGVVLLYTCVGVTGASAPYNGGASATHEIGHCFNLFHIWGDDGTSCSGTDNVADTPNQAGEHYTVNPPGSGVLTDACSTTSPGTMYMNYMDYTDDIRMANFTPGQNTRMQALFVSGGSLFSLTSSNGCTSPTGVVLATVTTNTPVTNIAATTATSGGNVSSLGGETGTVTRGVCWSLAANPTIALTTKTVDGSGLGTFTSSITGLFSSNTYHVRAYATNSTGTAYGADVTFTTIAAVTPPSVTTTAASAITATTATSGGNVTSAGGGTVTARGVCWSTTANPVATGLHTTDASGIGTFTSAITGLTQGTVYHVRAYATNSGGTGYGSDLTFTSLQTSFSLSGDITYFNAGLTPMTSTTVKLMSGATQVASTSTDVNGSFSFSGVASGTYTLAGTSTKPWAGVTSTDVLKMKRHIAGLELFAEPIVLTAADVNANGSISSTDVLKVLRRIASLDLSFTCSDWLFEIPYTGGNTVTMTSTNKSQSLYAICAGDVNGSNVPTLLLRQASISVDYSSVLKASVNETIDLPVRITNATELGAMQLIMNYPSDIFEVVGVSMNSNENDLVYHAENGKLSIVWASLESLKLNSNDAIVNVKIKAISNTATGSFSFGIQNESELADVMGHIIYGAGLSTSTIELSSISNVSLNEFNNSVSISPNPAKNYVYCTLGKLSSKDVKVTVYNAVGKQISVANKFETSSSLKLDFSSQVNGFYFIQIDSPEGRLVKKVSINK